MPSPSEGGIPLRHSSLFALLRGLADWRDGGFEAERLIDLLNTPGFAVPAPGALLRRLRGCKVWRGRERYALVWEPLPGDSETLCENRRAWKDFFALVFAALTPGDGQRDALAAFLQAHWRVRDAAAGAAAAQMRAVTAQLCNAGGDLVRLLLESGGDFRYSAAPAENALFCGTFDQCLGTGADVVYAAGLSANEMAARPAVSAFGAMPNAAGKDPALSLRTLLANHEGRAVLIRPDYTSDDLQEQPGRADLHPAAAHLPRGDVRIRRRARSAGYSRSAGNIRKSKQCEYAATRVPGFYGLAGAEQLLRQRARDGADVPVPLLSAIFPAAHRTARRGAAAHPLA